MSSEVSTLSVLMPNYLLPRSYHTCKSWEAKKTHLTLLIFYQFPSSNTLCIQPMNSSVISCRLEHHYFIARSYKKPPYLIACGYLCQFSAVLVKRRRGEVSLKPTSQWFIQQVNPGLGFHASWWTVYKQVRECVPWQKGVEFSCAVSVPSSDEAAPQSHEVFTHCALNPAMVKTR